MVNYQQGKIYKITSLQTDKIYIGSTCKKTLAERMAQHRKGYKVWKVGKSSKVMSYELFDNYDDCCIVLLENCPCNSRDELRARERYWIEQNLDKCLNKKLPSRSQKEYYEVNKDKIIEKRKEYTKKYYEQNKDKIIEKQKEYNKENETKIKDYQKKYRENNKDLE